MSPHFAIDSERPFNVLVVPKFLVLMVTRRFA